MRNAIVIEILVGILCPVVGSYPIVQRMVLYRDAIAHTVLPRLSLSFCLGIDIASGAIHEAARARRVSRRFSETRQRRFYDGVPRLVVFLFWGSPRIKATQNKKPIRHCPYLEFSRLLR